MNPRESIIEAQRLLDLNNRQMAQELRVSEFWYSKVVNGHRPPSDDLLLRLDDLIRRKGVVLGTTSTGPADTAPVEKSIVPGQVAGQVWSKTGNAAAIRKELVAHFNELLVLAGDHPTRLGWLLEQMRGKLTPPEHWNEDVHAELLDRALREEKAERRQKAHQSPPGKAQGGAGS